MAVHAQEIPTFHGVTQWSVWILLARVRGFCVPLQSFCWHFLCVLGGGHKKSQLYDHHEVPGGEAGGQGQTRCLEGVGFSQTAYYLVMR